MRGADYEVRETNRFSPQQAFKALAPEAAPIVRRMQALWESFRTPVIEVFPKAPGLPEKQKELSDLRRGDLSRRRISFAFHRKGIASRPN